MDSQRELIRSYKYRLSPTKRQEASLSHMLGDLCTLYNAALEERISAYRRAGKSLTSRDQWVSVRDLRHDADLPEFGRWSASMQSQVLRRLDKAFKAFFRRLKQSKGKAGFPRFKARDRFHAAEFQSGAAIVKDRLRVVGIESPIKVRWHRPLPAKPRWTIITRQAGRWYVVFQVVIPAVASDARSFNPVGIDVGLTSLLAMSDGSTVATPQWTRKAEKGLRTRARALSRAKIGSKRRKRVKLLKARYEAATAARRKDFAHKLSRRIVSTYSHIALEDMDVTRLARTMLAKAISNAAWGQIRQMIGYKAESAGSVVKLVDPRGTSQVCAECGASPPVPKKLSDRLHVCHECGYEADRDVNAARNILMRAEFIGLDRAGGREAGGLPLGLSANINTALHGERSKNAA